MKLKLLRELAEWEEVHDALVDLKTYWEKQERSTKQLQAVAMIKATIELVEDVMNEP